ncbi:hypothetical protein PB2503_05857 [Parvularcula bermudensis HTCC2503]|uniref:Uncharacterized protein n=1 Tax=Parvularcula bermudensis (strain ATCC BAA-594 / HTCC2503 / KCTC 12087) TaxID=314260 RepID=E0TH02_PARBH|nr:hypothetical protein [Parvularcula bermudensis]ADM09242.1 hypothetical protein PB2503_05857 [Parvularcula bermudensis HTCC2503]
MKIWASWGTPNAVLDAPIFAGSETIRMARMVYQISDPTDDQLRMF